MPSLAEVLQAQADPNDRLAQEGVTPVNLGNILTSAYGSLEDVARRNIEASRRQEIDPGASIGAVTLAMGATPFGLPGQAALGAGPIIGVGGPRRAENLWHGISQVKLPKPVSEMQASIEAAPVAERKITPADLQGGWLLPAIGDRSMASAELTGVGGNRFADPVALQGGHGYMPANTERGAIWASNKGVISGLEKKAGTLAESGDPVYFPYTAMGERAVDFSHHVADTLAEMLPYSKISNASKGEFNMAMRAGGGDFGSISDWPGLGSEGLRDYLSGASGGTRNKFAKTVDTAKFQQMGLPSAAEARFAVTDPRLLDVKTGDTGLSVSRLDPQAPRVDPAHNTYDTALPGQYVGGLGTSVPKELFYPDLIQAYEKMGYPPLRHDYLMSRSPVGAPIAQKADQEWVDMVSAFLRSKGILPALVGSMAGPTMGSVLQAQAPPPQ